MKQSFSIFIINLPKHTDRRMAIEKQLQLMHAKYEFVDGIFGDDKRVTERYDEAMAIKKHGKPMIKGEKGCALAHTLIYERMIQEKIPYALILEDDIVLPDDFLHIVEAEIHKKNKNWDWLLFDYRNIGFVYLTAWFKGGVYMTKQNPFFFLYVCLKAPYIVSVSMFEMIRNFLATKFPSYRGAKRFYRPLYNAGAYVLTLEGAKKLLPFTKPLCLTSDDLPNKARFRTNFNLYGYVPLIVKQDLETFGSSILEQGK